MCKTNFLSTESGSKGKHLSNFGGRGQVIPIGLQICIPTCLIYYIACLPTDVSQVCCVFIFAALMGERWYLSGVPICLLCHSARG